LSPSSSAMGMVHQTEEFAEQDSKPSRLYATQLGHAFVLVSNDLRSLDAVAKGIELGKKAFQTGQNLRLGCGSPT